MLNDRKIRELMARSEDPLVVRELEGDWSIQPCSVDVRLGRGFEVPGEGRAWTKLTVDPGDVFQLRPGGFALAETMEWIEVPGDVSARIEGKSSLGRRGLSVHVTAGFVDAGWKGRLTLELKNERDDAWISLRVGERIAQLSFTRLEGGRAERVYGSEGLGSKYQGSEGVVRSRG